MRRLLKSRSVGKTTIAVLWLLLPVGAPAQVPGDVLEQGATTSGIPCWAGERSLAAVYRVPLCSEIPSALDRAREICLKRWWFPGGQYVTCEGSATSACWGDLGTHPAAFTTPECKAIDERWKSGGGAARDRAAAEKAEREDRKFVERVAREGK